MSALKMDRGDELIALMSSIRQARPARKAPPKWEDKCTDRLGLFICRCGGAIDARVDLDIIKKHAASFPEVTVWEILDFCCSLDGREKIKHIIRENDLDRFVIAGCSPGIVEDLFRRTAMEARLNPYMVEIANIREQCALVHEKRAATEKASRLIGAAVAKCALLYPAPVSFIEVSSRRILVVGNRLTALLAAAEAADQGFSVTLVLTDGYGNLTGEATDKALERVHKTELIEVVQGATVEDFQGIPGDFKALISTSNGYELVDCGAVIVAMDRMVVEGDTTSGTSLDALEKAISERGEIPPSVVILIYEDCSDASVHVRAVEAASRIRKLREDSEVTVVMRDLIVPGFRELDYKKAQEAGVRFIRTEEPPEIEEGRVKVHDLCLGTEIDLSADLIVIAGGGIPPEMSVISKIFEIPVDDKGFLRGVHVKLKPVTSLRKGVFICGSAVSGSVSEVQIQASAAVSRAAAMLSQSLIELGGAVAEVEPCRCSACLTCVRSCPFNAPFIGEAGKAEIDISKCQGCGICTGICPSKAIHLNCCTDEQVAAQSKALCMEAIR